MSKDTVDDNQKRLWKRSFERRFISGLTAYFNVPILICLYLGHDNRSVRSWSARTIIYVDVAEAAVAWWLWGPWHEHVGKDESKKQVGVNRRARITPHNWRLRKTEEAANKRMELQSDKWRRPRTLRSCTTGVAWVSDVCHDVKFEHQKRRSCVIVKLADALPILCNFLEDE